MEEIWKDIDGFEGCYQVSNLGRVRSLERLSPQNHLIPSKILRFSKTNSGYLDIILYKDGVRYHRKAHRLVAEAFIENTDNLPEVDHIDTNKTNNRVDNLRWVTHKENHLNPLTVALNRKSHIGKKIPEEVIEKRRKKVSVYKDGRLLYIFKSFKDLDTNSKSIFGVQLWNVYARKVARGELESYHGYTFSVE